LAVSLFWEPSAYISFTANKEFTMNFINCLLDAVQTSDEEITAVIKNQACLMAGINPEEIDS